MAHTATPSQREHEHELADKAVTYRWFVLGVQSVILFLLAIVLSLALWFMGGAGVIASAVIGALFFIAGIRLLAAHAPEHTP